MATSLQHQWASGSLECHNRVPPPRPTKFEIVVHQLGLDNDPQAWPISNSLRNWAKKNRNRHYVPEELLNHWNLDVVVEHWI